jgi:hypothetical protein
VNENQKMVLKVVTGVIAAMMIFPPFHHKLPNGVTVNLGYSLIFEPPKGGYIMAGTVDIGMLLTQWIGVAIIGLIVFFLAKD